MNSGGISVQVQDYAGVTPSRAFTACAAKSNFELPRRDSRRAGRGLRLSHGSGAPRWIGHGRSVSEGGRPWLPLIVSGGIAAGQACRYGPIGRCMVNRAAFGWMFFNCFGGLLCRFRINLAVE